MIEAPATAEAATREYTNLVERIAHALRRKLPHCVDIDDLCQQGMIGLLQAVESFDAALEIDFPTYASHRVRGAMLDGLRETDWVSRSTRTLLRDIDRARHRAEHRKLAAVGAIELAQEMSISVGQLHELRFEAARTKMLYLEEIPSFVAFDDDEENDPLDRLSTQVFANPPFANPLDEIELQQRRHDLDEAIRSLTTRQRHLMLLYYDKGLRFSEIGTVLDVTESRVCQMHATIVKLLRTALQRWEALDPGYKIPAEGSARLARTARWQASRAAEARAFSSEAAIA